MTAVLSLGTVLLMSAIGFVVFTPISAAILFLASKKYASQVSYKQSLVPAVILSVINFSISLVLYIARIKTTFAISISITLVLLVFFVTLPVFFLEMDLMEGFIVGIIWWIALEIFSFLFKFLGILAYAGFILSNGAFS